YPDKEINEVGARGIGEIGLTGIAAAITSAVHHATGARVRGLPVKIENLLTSSGVMYMPEVARPTEGARSPPRAVFQNPTVAEERGVRSGGYVAGMNEGDIGL